METMAGCLQDQDDFHTWLQELWSMIRDQIRHPFNLNSEFHRKQIWLAKKRDELELCSALQHFETVITRIHF